VLTHHVPVNVVRIHVEMPAEERAESSRVKRSTRANHPCMRHTELGRKLRGNMRHDVYWISDNQKYCLRGVLQHSRDDLSENPGVSPK